MVELRYRIEPNWRNPYAKGIAFFVAAAALALPVVLSILERFDIIQLDPRFSTILIGLYAGLVMTGCVLVFTIPVFRTAVHSVDAVGTVKSFMKKRVVNAGRRITETAVSAVIIEYEKCGRVFQKSFGSLSFIGKKSVGDSVELFVSKKDPEKAMTRGFVRFSGLMIVPLFFMPLFAPILIIFWNIPVLVRAARSEKIAGKITEFTVGRYNYSPCVEYSYNGERYEVQLETWSSIRPMIGGKMKIKINSSDPNHIVSRSQLGFSIFATVIFSLGGLLFASIGFFAKNDPVELEEFPFLGYVISFGLVFILFLIGLIVCLKTHSELSKRKLIETGVPVSCVIKKITVNTSVYVQGRHPAKITCIGGGRTFELKMTVYPKQRNFYIGAEITVYVDEMNEKRFYADV